MIVDNSETISILNSSEKSPLEGKGKGNNKKRVAPKNTAVYVSNLPEDITAQELTEYFSKCGIIMDEILTGKPRVKLYYVEGHEEDSKDPILKGDALIVYLREESVRLALQILDESELRPGQRIRVQEASFDSNPINDSEGKETVLEEQDSNEKKRHRIDKETWKKHMRRMNKKLEWYDEEAEAAAKESARLARFSKIVVLKHMYTPADLTADPLEFPIQLSEEICEECEEKLGITGCRVEIVQEQVEEGVCTVKFKNSQEALLAIKLMNGRFFAGQRVSATIYDGSFALPKSNTAVVQMSAEEERLEQFSKWIESKAESSESDDHVTDDSDSNDSVSVSDRDTETETETDYRHQENDV